MSADVQFKFSFDKVPDLLDVEGKVEHIDEKGGLDARFQYRWCLEDDRNLATKKRLFGYEPCTQPGIKAPFGQNSGDGIAPRIKNGPETLQLMYRPVELMLQEREMYAESRKQGLIDENKMKHSGASSKCKIEFEKPEGKNPRGYVKGGR
jgi:hypothetical protein